MSPFFTEAATTPAALHELIAWYHGPGGEVLAAAARAFRDGGCRRIAFAGMGSSYSAPFAVVDCLRAHGITAIAATAHRLASDRTGLIAADTMVVAISKSGGTKEILDLADALPGSRGLIALTNQPESELARRAAFVLPMMTGRETQIASKSFVCTLAVLNLLAGELPGAPRPEQLARLLEIAAWASAYFETAADNNRPLLAAIANCRCIDAIASGASFSTAYKSALVLREVPHVTAAAIDAADYAHGWAKTAGPGYAGIMLAPDYQPKSVEARAVAQILDRGASAILITAGTAPAQDGLTVLRHPPVPEPLAPLPQAVACDAMIGAMPDRAPHP